MATVTSLQAALTRLVLATTLASITMATPQSIPGLDYTEILRTPSQEISASENIANLNMAVEGNNTMTNGPLGNGGSGQGVSGRWPLQRVEDEIDVHFDYDGPNIDKTTSNETELDHSNLISSRRGRILGRLSKIMESATSALLGSTTEPEDPKSKNPEPQDPAPPTNTTAPKPDESVQYVQAVRIPDRLRSQLIDNLRTNHQEEQHAGSSNHYDRQGKNKANYNEERNSFLGNRPTNYTPTSKSLFETFQSLFSKNIERSSGESDYKEHLKPSHQLARLDRRPFHSNPLNVKKDDKYGEHPYHANYYYSHNDLPFFHEPTPLYFDEDENKDVKSHLKSTLETNSEYPELKDYSEAFRSPRPYNTRPDAIASSMEITTFKPTVRYPVTTASNHKMYTTAMRRSDSPRKIRNAPGSLGILNHNLANANELDDPSHPERVSHVKERLAKQSLSLSNQFDRNQRPGDSRNLIPHPHFRNSNELYSPSPRDETNNHLFNRPAVEHHRDTNLGHHRTSMPSRHPTSLSPHHHTIPPTVRYSSIERLTPPKTTSRYHWSPTTTRPEATVVTARPRQAKSVEHPNEDHYVRDREPIFHDPRTNPMEVQYFEALEDEIRGSKFLTESVRLVSSNTFDDLIRDTLANKKKTTQKLTKNVSERARPSRIRPTAPYIDIQSNEIIRGKTQPQTQAPRLIQNKIVINIQDTDDHHPPPTQNTRHSAAPTPSSDALIDSMYNFRNFETPMVKYSSKEAWRNIDIHRYISNEYSSQAEHPSQYPRDLHRPLSPPSRPPSPPSRPPSLPSRPPSPPSRPPSPPSRPDSPTSRPASPISRPVSPTSRPPSPISRPASPTSRPPSPTSRTASPTSRPDSPSSRPDSPTSRPASPISRPVSPTSRPASPTSRPVSPTSRPPSPTSRPASPTSRPPSPISRPASPTSRPPSPSSRPPRPVSPPSTTVSRPSSPTSPPHSSVSHPHNQVSRPHSPASRHHSPASRHHSSVSHPHSSVSHPHSPVSRPPSSVSRPPSSVSRPPSSVSHPSSKQKKTIVTKYFYEKPTEDKSVHRPQNGRFATEHKTLDDTSTEDNKYNHSELVDHFPPEKEEPLYTYGHPETASGQSFFDESHENHDDRTSGVLQTQKPRPTLWLEEIFNSKPLSRIDPPPGYHPFQGNSPPIPQRPDTLTTHRPKYSAAAEVRDWDSSAKFADDLSSNNRKLDDYSSIFTENMGRFHLSNMNNRQSNYHIGSEATYGVHPTLSIGVGASYQTTKSPSKRPGEPIIFTSMPDFEFRSRSGFSNEDVTPLPSSISDKKEEPRSDLTETKQNERESRMSRSENGATSIVVPSISQTKLYVREPRMFSREKGATSFVVPTISQTKLYVKEPRMSRDGKEETSFIVPTFSQREMIATPSLLAAFFSQKKGKSVYERLSSVKQKPVLGSTERKPELEQGKSLDSGGGVLANADSTFPANGYNIDEFF